MHSFPEVDEYNTLGIPKDIEVTRSILSPLVSNHLESKIQKYTFVIEDKLTGAFIGLFGFNLGKITYRNAEVWYLIHPNFWGRGYATEALKCVIEFGFTTLKLHRITAGCAVGNIGSIKVLEKSGMQKEGRHREILPLKTGWSDNFEYAVLERDFG